MATSAAFGTPIPLRGGGRDARGRSDARGRRGGRGGRGGQHPLDLGGGTAAFVAAIVLAAAALIAVGAGIGVLNGRSPVRSGLRQLILGGAAALVTFGIGHLIGATVS